MRASDWCGGGARRAVGALLLAMISVTGCAAGGAAASADGGPSAALLPAAAAYVDAVAARDLDALVAAFAVDGVVVDVQRRIVGRDAIREWAAREVIGGGLPVDGVVELSPRVQRVRVHWAPAGSAGWAADYTFTVEGREIVEADLQYAR